MKDRVLNFAPLSLIVLTIVVYSTNAKAMNIIEAYEASLIHDKAYRIAKNVHQSGQQDKKIGLSSLLPNVSASYAINQNDLDVERSGFPTEERDYVGKNTSLQLTQSIINMDGLARYRQGKAQTTLSDYRFAQDKQTLITKVFELYMNVLANEEIVGFSILEKNYIKRQKEANEVLFASGEATKTDVIESEANLSLSEARLIEAKLALDIANDALEKVVGQATGGLDGFSASFDFLSLPVASFEELSQLALATNPDIAVFQQKVAVAAQEVKINAAGHYPRLDLVARYNQSSSDTVATFNQDIDARSIGVQLNIPIYSGGLVSAQVTKSTYDHARAKDELLAKKDAVIQELKEYYNTLEAKKLKLKALEKSLESALLQVEATEKSFSGGIRSNLDVLKAQNQLFDIQKELAVTKYQYIKTYVQVKRISGSLTDADVHKMNASLVRRHAGQ